MPPAIGTPRPPEPTKAPRAAAALIDHGLRQHDVELMIKRNPAELLGLNDSRG